MKTDFNLNVPEDQLHLGIDYLSFIAHRYHTGFQHLDQIYVGGLAAHTPFHNKGFLTIPIRQLNTQQHYEFDQNSKSLGFLSNFAICCLNGEYPPDDSYENLLQWVEKYFPHDYYLILKSSELISPLISYRGAIDDRKYSGSKNYSYRIRISFFSVRYL